MRIHTVHVRAGAEPVLVREGFSVWALLLPTIWFLAHRMVAVALLHLLALGALAALLPAAVSGWVLLAVQVLVAMQARDIRRWALERRGFVLAGVVAGRNEEEALLRLASERPELFGALPLAGTHIAGMEA